MTTTFATRHLLHELAELNIPYPEEVVLNHGGALVTWGVRDERPEGDIDAATNLENNLYLENELGFRAVQLTVGFSKEGKERTVVSRRDEHDRFDIHRWDFSMYRFNRTGKGRLYLTNLATMSVQDPETGIWVLRPEFIRETKLETGRPKDEKDISLIDEFIARHN